MTKMKNTIKASVGLWLLAVSNVALAASNSSSNYTRWNEAEKLRTTNTTLDNVIINWIGYITSFLYLVAVVIGLWWAFNILTAAGGKDIIIRAVFWIVAIFSINIIMKFVIEALFSNS